MAKEKKFRLIDAILSVITVVFVAEAAAPAAAIGNSQFFWWIFLIIAFLLPYGLVVSELGTTYDDEGGLYDWVRRAFGDKWASRVSWYYWINFPLWMASLAILFPETIMLITGVELGLLPSLLIELAFIWIVVFLSFSKVSDSTWILNLAAVLKVGIALVLGCLGIWFGVTYGFANDMSPETFLPAFDTNSLTYLVHHPVQLHGLRGHHHVRRLHGEPDEADPEGHHRGRHRHRGALPVQLVRHQRRHPGVRSVAGFRHHGRGGHHGGLRAACSSSSWASCSW